MKFIAAASARTNHSFGSTAHRYPGSYLKANFLGMREALSPARSKTEQVDLRPQKAGHCYSSKSGRFHWSCRRSFCGSCRKSDMNGWAKIERVRQTYES